MYALATAAALVAAAFVVYQSGPATANALTPWLRWTAPALALILAGFWAMFRAGRTKPHVPN
jgi:ABC-type nickel/cobalt efflux system permease component RcnA